MTIEEEDEADLAFRPRRHVDTSVLIDGPGSCARAKP